MTKKQVGIVQALATVFFQEGFDRKDNKHGLDYWRVKSEELSEHCKQVKIHIDEDGIDYILNTEYDEAIDQWFLRLTCITYDDYGGLEDINVMVMIPIDPERLCWEEFGKCSEIVDMLI